MFISRTAAMLAAALCTLSVSAQTPVATGSGSYASYPPAYKAATADHEGFNASKIEGKKIFVDEVPGRPIPTNDWWTDVINSRYSGALWSLPQMLYTGQAGVTVHYPTHWNENGTEVKPSSSIRVGGRNFAADATIAEEWGDWHVKMRMPSASGNGTMRVTMAHGMPFTWFEFDNVEPELAFSATPRFIDVDGNSGTRPRGSVMGVVLGNDLYGIYLPEGAVAGWNDGQMTVKGNCPWMVIALLTTPYDLDGFADYATSVPRLTEVGWTYDEARALIHTSWAITAENLRSPGKDAPVLQGFLPHAYKTTQRDFRFSGHEYLTPRGTLKLAAADGAGTTHRFGYAYRFDGMMPYYAAPKVDNGIEAPYNPKRMKELINNYAANGTFGADTYWGGKGLTQMALNMTFAKETGNEEAYAASRRKLREMMENWLTYTPGEDRCFFAYYPRWGALVGFDPSYDSDAFNDHHFHYGYFIYAGALLCLEDADFARQYGPMLKAIAKDYANYDRNDTRFPFLRTLDIWAGHSYAGGLGDAGNDNGNGQESSSEAMQSWGGLYLLGVALGDRQMRDAGIFGYMTESNAVAEYWFDRDQIHPDRQHNYDYTKYTSPYCTNLTSKGIGWWTWFSGDPLWMHSIQWMPVSPCLNYLSKDKEFVKWDYEKMIQGSAYEWFTGEGDTPPLASQSVGNVALCYMERYNPDEAAGIFDRAYVENFSMARATDTGHISYYLIHSHRTYGDLDFDVWADCPTANAYRRADGSMTYMVYNPGADDLTVTFYRGNSPERTVKAPAGMTAFSAPAVASAIILTPGGEAIIPPGGSQQFTAKVVDQYGAEAGGKVTFALSPAAPASVSEFGTVTVNSDARKPSVFTLTATCGSLASTVEITVNNRPEPASITITPAITYSEINLPITLAASVTDQYGQAVGDENVDWSITDNEGKEFANSATFTPTRPGIITATASSGTKSASATINITPPMSNIALGATAITSSEENAGCLTANINDGDPGSRWGSNHSDDQWAVIDLGEDAYISRVNIAWEAAYASEYEIQLAPDGAKMTRFTGSYAGAQKTVSVPANDQWVTAAQVSGCTGGNVSTPVGASGRYVRMRGIKRGSAYGYSIYEIGVYGIASSKKPADVIGLLINAPAVIDQGETASIDVKAYTLGGQLQPAAATLSADKPADIAGSEITPTAYGRYTITAQHASASAQAVMMVNEVARTVELNVTPAKTQIIAGQSRRFELTALNQFGAVMPVEPSALNVKILRADLTPAEAAEAEFNLSTLTFTSFTPGTYILDFNNGAGRAEIIVSNIASANLAIGHPATASAANGGNSALLATDGDPATRWESPAEDGHYLTVDLEDLYLINRVDILWEGAYAADYRIQTSVNGETWATAAVETGHSAAGRASHAIDPQPARYVRVRCDRRATAWGNSLYELEVYGSERITPDDSDEAPEITEFNLSTGNGCVTLTGAASHPSGFVTATFEVKHRDSGRLVDSQSLSGCSETVFTASVSGLYKGVDYVAIMTATDLNGNTSRTTREFTGKYSIDGLNLALNKAAGASSVESEGLRAVFAVDGNASTRWGSEFRDGEWIKIDLGEIFPVSRIEIDWNNPAFATDYDIMLAAADPDGINNSNGDDTEYSNVAHIAAARGGTIATNLEAPLNARFVKVRGNARATAYGVSIDELRVYGVDALYDPEIPTDPSDDEADDWQQWGDWDKWGKPAEPEQSELCGIDTSDPEVDVYNLRGELLRHRVARSRAAIGLPPGIYLRRENKKTVKMTVF